jgi:hypothetical protein
MLGPDSTDEILAVSLDARLPATAQPSTLAPHPPAREQAPGCRRGKGLVEMVAVPA